MFSGIISGEFIKRFQISILRSLNSASSVECIYDVTVHVHRTLQQIVLRL